MEFGKDKSYISDIDRGFEYLGIRFKRDKLFISDKKIEKKLSSLSQKTQKLPLIASIQKINEHINGVKNYYLKLINDYSQFAILQKHINSILIQKIIYSKEHKIITNQTKFKTALQELEFYGDLTQKEKDEYIDKLIQKAYEELALKTPIKEAKKEIVKSKKEYLKNSIQSSEIILNKFGLFVGIGRGKIIVKEKGKVLKKVPLNYATRIIVQLKELASLVLRYMSVVREK